MHRLHVVVTSTRPTRVGLTLARWFLERAREHGKVEAELVNLKEIDLPAMDEPRHPRFRQYEHEHTKRWSAKVDEADAFVFVVPEYNYSAPPALLNAINYLSHEWAYKPVGFVSYGGVSGGVRSVQMVKQVVTAVKMMPMQESVTVPFVAQHMDEHHAFDRGPASGPPPAPSGTSSPVRFKGGEAFDKAAVVMLDELERWTTALKTLRAPRA